MKDIKGKNILLFLFLLLCLGSLYYGAKQTYTAYESSVDSRVANDISDIHLRINGEEIRQNGVLNNRVILDNVTWVSTHTRAEKISPGSTGSFQLELDPTGSEVAILYELQFVDKVVDDDKILNFGNIVSDDTLIQTAADTYSGIITLNQIQSLQKIHINVGFSFDASHDIEGFREDNQAYDDFFEIHVKVYQYLGETLVPYTE